jgi:hypothetical protein
MSSLLFITNLMSVSGFEDTHYIMRYEQVNGPKLN